MKNKNEFLEDLACLLDKYANQATLSYCNDDSGTIAYINGVNRDLIELGFLDIFDAAKDIRGLKDSNYKEVVGEVMGELLTRGEDKLNEKT